jgi:integrase
MSRPRPPHLQRHKTRHGKFIWVVQIGSGPIKRVRAEFGEPGFEEAYQAALSLARTPTTKSIAASKGTLRWAWLLYQQSGAWTSLSQATRNQRENIMAHVLEAAGLEPLGRITGTAIQDGLDRRKATPFQAKNFLQTMKQLFEWLKDNKHVRFNPCAGLKAKTPKTRGFPEWAYEEILKYEERWPLGTRQRVMLDVYCYTGLRRGDAARLGKQHVANNVIVLATEKSQGQTVVHIPILDVLKRTLDAGPIGDLAFIVTSEGKPFVKEGLGNAFKDACVAAGIPGKSAHGLRKAAATRAADNGATAHELMAIFGWIDIKEAEIYTRAADRKRLAAGAIHKLEQGTS